MVTWLLIFNVFVYIRSYHALLKNSPEFLENAKSPVLERYCPYQQSLTGIC